MISINSIWTTDDAKNILSQDANDVAPKALRKVGKVWMVYTLQMKYIFWIIEIVELL